MDFKTPDKTLSSKRKLLIPNAPKKDKRKQVNIIRNRYVQRKLFPYLLELNITTALIFDKPKPKQKTQRSNSLP